MTTALALDWFQQQNAEDCILENGMGGRIDATNIVTPVVYVLTRSVDQCSIRGTLAEIAGGKRRGIIKPGVPVVSRRSSRRPRPSSASQRRQAGGRG